MEKYLSLQWHITEKCGNNCKHCYMEKNNEDLSLNQLYECLDNLKNFEKNYKYQITRISITGGDPLARSDWYEFASKVVNYGKRVNFLGNPELLNDANIKKLQDLNIEYYQMSLDGLETTHDQLRQNGSFQRTIQAIKKLHKHKIQVAIMFTLSEVNKDDLFPLLEYLDKLNINIRFAFDFVIPIGNAKKENLPLYLEMDNIFSNYLRKKEELQSRNSKLHLLEKSSFIRAYKFKNNILNYDIFSKIQCNICSGCGATWNHFTILNNGNACICRRMPVILGNIISDNLNDVFINNELIKEFQNKKNYIRCGSCKYFKFCRGCPALERGISGNCFSNQLPCQYYEEDKNKSNIIENEVLGNKVSNHIKESNNYSINYLKAYFLLSITRERKEAQHNYHKWKEKHNLIITEAEDLNIMHKLLTL